MSFSSNYENTSSVLQFLIDQLLRSDGIFFNLVLNFEYIWVNIFTPVRSSHIIHIHISNKHIYLLFNVKIHLINILCSNKFINFTLCMQHCAHYLTHQRRFVTQYRSICKTENVTLCSYCLVGLCVILNSFLETVCTINI